MLLAALIFGGAALFSYKIFVRPEMVMRAERAAAAPAQPTPGYQPAGIPGRGETKGRRQTDRSARALTAFIQKYPSGLHAGEAQDLLGDVNTSILLSDYPSPEKEEYVVRSGDVLARIAAKLKSTPELIMRTNNLSGTMLHIGDKLLVSRPEFSILIQRNAKLLYLLDHERFFKRYHLRDEKLPANPPAKITTRVAEIMAWKNGKRIGIGSPDFLNSTRWIRLGAPGYLIYAEPDDSHQMLDVPPPEQGLGMSATDVEELSSLVNTRTAVTITQ